MTMDLLNYSIVRWLMDCIFKILVFLFPKWVVNGIRVNLRKPNKYSFFGLYVKKFFIEHNAFLEKKAVELCGIKGHHNVLEIGFGPGIGLKHACQSLKDGKLSGIDYSTAMVQHTEKSLSKEIESGKLNITSGTVYNMPYEDHTFDIVYHVNCYYFWDDMKTACEEIHRVMKPGSRLVTIVGDLTIAVQQGALLQSEVDVDRYMTALKEVGFKEVQLVEVTDDEIKYEYIQATSAGC